MLGEVQGAIGVPTRIFKLSLDDAIQDKFPPSGPAPRERGFFECKKEFKRTLELRVKKESLLEKG